MQAKCIDLSLPDDERRAALRIAFFAPSHEPPADWLSGWHPAAGRSKRAATNATPRVEWWHPATAPVLNLQDVQDPWRPRATVEDFRHDLGAGRVTVQVIEDCSRTMIPKQPGAVVNVVLAWMRSKR